MNFPDTIMLQNIDPEDICDVLLKVEGSFGFKFDDKELKEIKTFGELCDIITNKVQGENANDCTTQQAFYKLKSAISGITSFHKESITIDSNLKELLPRKARRQQVNSLETELGFKTNILRPRHWLTLSLAFVFLVSLIGLYFSWQAGLIGIAFAILTMKLVFNLGKELDLITVGELAEKIAREHYNKVRRNSSTINRNEVVQKVKELFMADLDLEEEVLTRDATFG